MAETKPDEMAHRINATNPSKLEMQLSIAGPGAPESLEEATCRVLRGQPVVEGDRETDQTE